MTTSSQVVEVAEILQEISLMQLEPSSRNPRRTVNPADIKELAASIREHGVQVPLIVRKIDFVAAPLLYEIVAGHRRYEAARLEKLVTLPCLVRNLSDEEAAEIALIDNLQRVDVPAMEEAEAFGQLLERLGSIAAVAARVGKELAYVAKRLKLRTLTLCSQDALRVKLISIDHALLLARLAEDEQNEALKWCLDHQAGAKKPVEDVLQERLGKAAKSDADADSEDDDEEDGEGESRARRSVWNHVWEPQSVQRLKEHIECESGTPLDRAPWPMEEDWLLPDAGSCLDCEKNTKANVPLFGDLDMGVAVCTDGGCFKDKTQAFVQIQTRDAAKAMAAAAKIPGKSPNDFEVLRVSWKATSTVPRQLKDGGGVNPSQTFKDGQWEEATKKCEFARPAVTVDWSDANNRGYMGGGNKLRKPGEIVQACIQPKCKVHKKSYEKAASSNTNSSSKVSHEEQQRLQKEADQVEKVETEIRAKIFRAILDKVDGPRAVHLVADETSGAPAWRKKLVDMYPTISGDKLEALALFCCRFERGTHGNSYWLMEPGGVANDRKQLWGLAVAAGVDANALAAKHFHDQYQDASSLKSLGKGADRLYPKGVAWPKDRTAAAPKKTLPTEAKKRIAAGVKKAAAVPAKAPAKKVPAKKAAKKGGRK